MARALSLLVVASLLANWPISASPAIDAPSLSVGAGGVELIFDTFRPLCLSVPPPVPAMPGPATFVSRCEGNALQRFSPPGEGDDARPIQNAALGLCLEGFRIPGGRWPISLSPCDGSKRQDFVWTSDDKIYSPFQDLCVGFPEGSDLADPELVDCNVVSTWRLRSHSRFRTTAHLDAARVAIDLSDERRVFASGEDAISRSLDGGQTWSAVRATDTPTPPIVVAAATADTTGETGAPIVWFGVSSLEGSTAAVSRSLDGGETWNSFPVPDPSTAVTALALSPDDRDRLFAAGSGPGETGGVYRSLDGGVTWAAVGPAEPIEHLATATGGAVFAVGPGGLWRSLDDGDTWAKIDDSSQPVSVARWVGDLYLARPVEPIGEAGAIERSSDGGETWYLQAVPGCAAGARPLLHPTVGGTLFLADAAPSGGACVGSAFWTSLDGGMRWTRVGGVGEGGVADLVILPVTNLSAGNDRVDHLVALFEDHADTAVKRVATTRLGAIPPLALGRDRFSVDIVHSLPNGLERGRSVDLASDSGLAWFFDRQNLELLVKVLDGRAINGHFWVFWGASTDVAFEILVTDHATGERRTFESPGGAFTSGADLQAFADPDRPDEPIPTFGPEAVGYAEVGPVAPIGPDGRFRARVVLEGSDANAFVLAEDTAGFWYFDRGNVELLVKVLDGRTINGHFWVYWGSTSDVAFDLCVEDTEAADPADAERCWSNPAGTFASGGDITAFE